MIAQEQVRDLIGATVYGSDGEKIGKAGQVFLDDETGRPEWVTVHTGFFGTRESFIPLAEASAEPDRITVPYTKDTVKDAPHIDADQHLSRQEEAELYTYYGLSYGEARTDGGFGGPAATTTESVAGVRDTEDYGGGRDTSGPSTDDAMTRSEERLNVGTEREQVGRAKLRKYVVTEQVQQTVPVSREEVRVEREPITDENVDRAMAGPAISEEEHEVTLHAERPVVDKEAVPVERVRLDKETVTDHETVSDEVRKERIEADGADLESPRR